MREQPIAKVAGVTGWPIHHSLSPVLHTHWLRQLGINGAYTMFAVHPDDAVDAFKSLVHTTIKGVNVTIPLKEKAYQAADELTPEARLLGVCNLLYTRGNKIIGHNTDLEGFLEPLLRKVGRNFVSQNPICVVGAGGAAKAVIGALLSLEARQIRVINRTDQRAYDLVQKIGVKNLHHVDWSMRNHAVDQVGLVVNASAAGMHGNPALDLSLTSARPDAWVYDLIYTPRITPLMRQAKALNLKTIGGLDMLIAQARPSFYALYGEHAPIDGSAKKILIQALRKR